MTQLYTAGDVVKIDGQEGVILSWPVDNHGNFQWSYIASGIEHRKMDFYGEQDGEPIAVSVVPELVRRSDDLPASLAVDPVDPSVLNDTDSSEPHIVPADATVAVETVAAESATK